MADVFDFDSSEGHRLSGRLEAPESDARTWALLAHCFTCGKDNVAAVRVARGLAAAGIGTLRFDFAGLGASGGTFGTKGLASDVSDLLAAAAAMEKADIAPTLLIGHSLGGAAALAATAHLPTVRAVATIAAPFEAEHALNHVAPEALAAVEAEGEGGVLLAGRRFTLSRAFVEDLRGRDQGKAIAALGRPLLVLHAPRDETVGIEHAGRIFAAAKHPKSFVSLDNADHALSARADADYAAAIIAAWATPYLEKKGAEAQTAR
jgi:putative redox protein